MKLKSLFVLFFMGFTMSAFANDEVRAPASGDLKPFVPAPIGATGVPVCDQYFSDLEVCMKKQTTAAEFQEVLEGINEVKQLILSFGTQEEAVEICKTAIERARVQYAGVCAFN